MKTLINWFVSFVTFPVKFVFMVACLILMFTVGAVRFQIICNQYARRIADKLIRECNHFEEVLKLGTETQKQTACTSVLENIDGYLSNETGDMKFVRIFGWGRKLTPLDVINNTSIQSEDRAKLVAACMHMDHLIKSAEYRGNDTYGYHAVRQISGMESCKWF